MALTERDVFCLWYHSQVDRNSSCGSMADDMANLLAGNLDFAKDGRLFVTKKGKMKLAEASTIKHGER